MGPLQAYTSFIFDVSDARNAEDIRDYLGKELQRHNGGIQVPAATIDSIVSKSGGLFMYAEWIIKELDQGRLSLNQLDTFPKGLGGIYLQYFGRQFPDSGQWEAQVRPAPEVIVASQEPQQLALLSQVFGWGRPRHTPVPAIAGLVVPVRPGLDLPLP
jgi:hypothetical protein